jgi:hypothetical protein
MLALMLSALAVAVARRGARMPHWPVVLFCAASVLGLMIGPVLTVEFWIRFLMPALPPLCLGTALAAEDMLSLRASDGGGPSDHQATA